MNNVLIIALAALLLAGLLYFEKKAKTTFVLPVKSVLSLLFILAVLIQPHPVSMYYHFLLAGMLFCLAGDVFLAFPGKKTFLFGLVSFLSGHVFYIFGFFYIAKTGFLTLAASFIVLFFSGLVYYRLKPYLGKMNIPVLFYIIVISIMLVGASSMLGNSQSGMQGRLMVFGGALSFYFSDIFVARNRFLKKEFLNRLVGLPMYYFGQFLLAFSVGLIS